MLAQITPGRRFSDLVSFFMEHSIVDEKFSMGELESFQEKAKWIDDLELALEVHFFFFPSAYPVLLFYILSALFPAFSKIFFVPVKWIFFFC